MNRRAAVEKFDGGGGAEFGLMLNIRVGTIE